MTIAELKEKLKDLPDHMDVFIKQENQEYPYSLVGIATVRELEFGEDSGPVLAKDNVFVLTDEM